MKKLLLGIFILIPYWMIAQDECESSNNKAKKSFQKGIEEVQTRNYEYAKLYLLDAISLDETYALAYFHLAKLEEEQAERIKLHPLKSKDYEQLILNFRKYIELAAQNCPELYQGDALYFWCEDLVLYQEEYIKAIPLLKKYIALKEKDPVHLKEVQKWLHICQDYQKITSTKVPFDPKMVDGVSTSTKKEYLPFLSADQEKFYYTRSGMKSDKGDLYDRYLEEFTISDVVDGNLNFNGGKPMPYPFNQVGESSELKEGGACLTIDNKQMFVTKCKLIPCDQCLPDRTYWNCDIFETKLVNNEWLPLQPIEEINQKFTWESQPTISADGKTLYFVSNREGGIGTNNLDIYKSEKEATGKWSSPQNLGNIINTEYDEKSPFMHSDSKTLYFSSNKPGGLGNFDIYWSTWNNDNWNFPNNIGFPINTEGDDLGFFVSTDGTTGYFTSDKLEKSNDFNIYGFELYPEARPKKVLFLKGQLKDENGDPLQDAALEIKNTGSNEVSLAMIDKETGEYAIAVTIEKEVKEVKPLATQPPVSTPKDTLKTSPTNQPSTIDTVAITPAKKDSLKTLNAIDYQPITQNNPSALPAEPKKPEYILKVKKQGYAYSSQLIDVEDSVFSKPVTVDVALSKIEVGKSYTLNDIYFATNSAEINQKSLKILDDFIEFLIENPTLKIGIYGHTDNVGNANANLDLSKRRAKSVQDYLISQNISPERLLSDGYGATKPIADNKTEEGRSKNRRTEFTILSK